VILFEAGLRLSFDEITPGVRKAVVRLVVAGAALTWLAITATVGLLVPRHDRGAAIRPIGAVRALLKWEGTLGDPIGALLGVSVFLAVGSGKGWRPGSLLIDLGVGVLVAAAGAPVLWLLLREVHRG